MSNEDRKNSGDAVVRYLKIGIIAVAVVLVAAIGYGIWYTMTGSTVATVGSEKISRPEYEFFLKTAAMDMISKAQAKDPNVDITKYWDTKIDGEDARTVVKKKALESARDLKLQLIKAKEDKVTLDQSEIDMITQQVDGFVIQMYQTKANGDIQLKKQYGVTSDELKEILKERSLADKYKSKQLESIPATDADLKAVYDKSPDKFMDTQFRTGGAEAVWARHILIATVDTSTNQPLPEEKIAAAEKKANDLLARAKAGEDFVKLAKENSEDPGSKEYGGDYVFSKGQMYPEFEAAAFALSAGEVSNIVKTSAGYHIIKLEEKIPQGKPVSLRCATEYREFGLGIVKEDKYQQIISGLKDKYKLDINNSVYNSINVDISSLLQQAQPAQG